MNARAAVALLQPGDLLFWGSSPGAIHHVALYAGGGMLLGRTPHRRRRRVGPGLGGDFYAAPAP